MLKSKPLSMKNITRLPSATKERRLTVEILSESFISINNRPIPAFFGSLERPAIVCAKVTFENDEDCQGQHVEINYKACAVFEVATMTSFNAKVKFPHNYQRKRWTMQGLNRPSPGVIGAGKYSQIVTATIDPLWPSSSLTSASMNGMGWVRYSFEAQFVRVAHMGSLAPILTTIPQEAWVFNSILPSEPIPSIPKTVKLTGKNPDLPVSFTIPNQTLQFHEQVPLTVHVETFRRGCKKESQNIVVLTAGFTIKERVVGYTQGASFMATEQTRDVIHIAIREGWPQGTKGDWVRTVRVTLPSAPDINASMTSKSLDISHAIVFSMKVKAENEADHKAKEISVEVPRHNIEHHNDEFLPIYNTSDTHTLQQPLPDYNDLNLPDYVNVHEE
ncbi:hypothetical protein FBU30_002521 [Linnemannia zychae]|nr:hypothetical protein FBU30_002521 [Linnemannia zychae]